MERQKEKAINPDKVGLGRLFAWNSRTVSIGVMSIIIGYLSFYCTDVLGMPAALVGTVLMASKLCDGVTDLFAGWLVDNTNTKLGKARPYEFCILGVWIACACLFSTPVSWGNTAKSIWLFIMYTLLYSVFFTMLNASETPYVIRAFGTQKAIVKVSAYGGVITTLVSTIVAIVCPIIVEQIGTDASTWRRIIILTAIPCGILGLLRFIFVKEDRVEYIENREEEKPDEKVSVKDILYLLTHNKYMWMFALIVGLPMMIAGFYAYTYYFNIIVGDISKYSMVSMSALFLILFMFLVPALMKKFSAIGIVILFSVIGIIGNLINFWAGASILLLFFGAVGQGAGCMPYSYMKSPVILQISEYNARMGMKRMEGTVASVINFIGKVLQAFGGFIFGVLLSASGYDGTLSVQPDSAVTMIRLSYSLIPVAIYVVVIILCFCFKSVEKK